VKITVEAGPVEEDAAVTPPTDDTALALTPMPAAEP
jgi:hypothetical protein